MNKDIIIIGIIIKDININNILNIIMISLFNCSILINIIILLA